jgi:hypothetical protein
MGSEDLNQGDFQCGNLAVQEDTSEIELHLETNVDVCSVKSQPHEEVRRAP